MKRKQGSSSGKLSMARGKRRRNCSSASASTSQNLTIATDTAINALPDELLIAIFLLLPLYDLGRVERVCKTWRELIQAHGWRSVHHFDDGDTSIVGLSRLGKRAQLLALIGSHLRSAALTLGESKDLGLEHALGMCPNLAHLSLHRCGTSYLLDSSAIEHIRSNYSTQLRTLSLGERGLDYNERAMTSPDVFNKLIGELVSLEYLHLNEPWRLIGELQFPPSMASIRKLGLHTPMGKGGYKTESSPLLEPANIAVLASFPQLRSLTLDCNISFVSYSFLKAFPHLEHLCVEASLPESHDSLTADALPHMGALKAIEVRYFYSKYECTRNPAEILAGLFTAAASAQGTTNQQLEHIGLTFSKRSNHRQQSSRSSESFEFPDLPPPVAERLVSLEVEWPGKWRQPESWCGRQLPEMPRMEHLSIASWSPSLADVCTIMEKCKKLRYFDVGDFELNTGACGAMAASANLSQKQEKMMEGARQEDPSAGPFLCIRAAAAEKKKAAFYYADDEQKELKKEEALSLPRGGAEYGCSRLRFTRDAASSHVLHRYAYGCLSEKLPPSFMLA